MIRRDAGDNERLWRGQDVRRQTAANVDPVPFYEILIRPDCSELQRLVELRRDAGGFNVIEDEIHVTEPSVLRRYDPQDNDSTSSVALGGGCVETPAVGSVPLKTGDSGTLSLVSLNGFLFVLRERAQRQRRWPRVFTQPRRRSGVRCDCEVDELWGVGERVAWHSLLALEMVTSRDAERRYRATTTQMC